MLSRAEAVGGLAAYAVDHVYYPNVNTVAAIKVVVDPIFINSIPLQDGWSNDLQAASFGNEYTIYSHGKDATGTTCTAALTSTFIDQICFVNGRFLRYPEGMQN